MSVVILSIVGVALVAAAGLHQLERCRAQSRLLRQRLDRVQREGEQELAEVSDSALVMSRS